MQKCTQAEVIVRENLFMKLITFYRTFILNLLNLYSFDCTNFIKKIHDALISCFLLPIKVNEILNIYILINVRVNLGVI